MQFFLKLCTFEVQFAKMLLFRQATSTCANFALLITENFFKKNIFFKSKKKENIGPLLVSFGYWITWSISDQTPDYYAHDCISLWKSDLGTFWQASLNVLWTPLFEERCLSESCLGKKTAFNQASLFKKGCSLYVMALGRFIIG